MNSRIYTCKVMHARHHPVRHKWALPYYVCAFDLDELESLERTLVGFGTGRRHPISLRGTNYLRGTGSFRDKLAPFVDVEAVSRIMLVTLPRVVVRGFNPVSFYYGLREDGIAAWIVAEVNNTFKERHLYVLEGGRPFPLHCEHAKQFHVSPFNNMEGHYEFEFSSLGEQLRITITLIRDGVRIMDASLSGDGQQLTSRTLWKTVLLHPLTAALTMPRILGQAALLHYRKKLPIFKKPDPNHQMTIIGTRP